MAYLRAVGLFKLADSQDSCWLFLLSDFLTIIFWAFLSLLNLFKMDLFVFTTAFFY